MVGPLLTFVRSEQAESTLYTAVHRCLKLLLRVFQWLNLHYNNCEDRLIAPSRETIKLGLFYLHIKSWLNYFNLYSVMAVRAMF